ncbi:MAG: hypothetical protein AAGA96_03020 [Verrucomicrobiota bacterium]
MSVLNQIKPLHRLVERGLDEIGWFDLMGNGGDSAVVDFLVSKGIVKREEDKEDAGRGDGLLIVDAETGRKDLRSSSVGNYVRKVVLKMRPDHRETDSFERLEDIGFRLEGVVDCHAVFGKVGYTTEVLQQGLELGDEEAINLLEPSKHYLRRLDGATKWDLCRVDAASILMPSRFDVGIKALYAKLYLKGIAKEWREQLYSEHISRITGETEEIKEHDGSGKSGIDEFASEFHRILECPDADSLPIVPLDEDMVAIDGAHRIARGIARKERIQVARIHGEKSHSRAPADFFLKGHGVHPPMPKRIVDESALEYCRCKSGLVLAVIFPSATSNHFALKTLKELGEIVHTAEYLVDRSVGAGVLRQIYLGHHWADPLENKSPGFLSKIDQCFPFAGTITGVLLDRVDHSRVREIKREIRDYYECGSHSIHITDSDEEAFRTAQIFFNTNSLDFLRMGVTKSPLFHERVAALRQWIEEKQLHQGDFCIDGGSVLELLNLRSTRDIDFLYTGPEEELGELPVGFDCHNCHAGFHAHPRDEIVMDPQYHGYYMGLKFCTPKVVAAMKSNRGEAKDMEDVRLLKSKFMFRDRFPLMGKIVELTLKTKGHGRAFYRRSIERLKVPLRPFVRRLRGR